MGTSMKQAPRIQRARQRPRRQRWLTILCASAVFIGTAVLSTAPSGANHASIFELEGNAVDSPAGAPWDWTTFFDNLGGRKTPLPTGFIDSGFDADHAFPDSSTFTGGSKDTLDVSGWSCTDSNNLGGKFDIVNAYASIYEVPTTGGDYSAGDQLLFFGIERAATEGDGNMGLWFLKDGSVDCDKPVGATGKAPAFTGNHTDGDIFVVAGFSNGGTSASVAAYKWNGGANGSLSATPFVTSAETCTSGATASHQACGVVNTATLATNADKPWPSPDKNGGDLDVNAFYEGFVRVPATQNTGCFATFVANTRSSTSPTATIHDFSRGSFPTCQPSTTMTGLATPTTASPDVVVAGDQVTYTFREKNDGNVALTNVYVVTDNTACNSALSPANVSTLAPDATATFSCTLTTGTTGADTTIRAVGHGTATIGGTSKDVTVCGANALPFPSPTTAHCDADEQDSARSVSIEPGTEMTISASPATVKEGDTVTFTFTETNDGTAPTGFDSSLDLTNVAVSTDSTGCNATLTRTLPTGSSDQTLSKGETWTYQCTVSAPADDFTVVATGTGTVLAGTSHARNVTFSSTCTNSSGSSTTTGTYCDSEEQVSKQVTVVSPSTSLTVTASAVITYTFVETNDSSDAPLTPPIPTSRESLLTAEEGMTTVCNVTGLAYSTGDTGDDKILSPGESWTFTCTGSLAGPSGDTGSSSKVATGRGNGTAATGDNVTYCAPSTSPTATVCDTNERDRVTVSITNQARGHDPSA